jgi:murein hydrolase activator
VKRAQLRTYLLAFLLLTGPVIAQQPADIEAERKLVEDNIKASEAARLRLDAEMNELRTDRTKLNTTLLDTTRKAQEGEERASILEKRLTTLQNNEATIRRSFDARSDLIAQVLAALQRMGRKPPPAVLVRPDDILEAVRSSLLLGAVVPELRLEVEALSKDLAELSRLRLAVMQDKEQLAKELAQLAQEQQRLGALIKLRQERIATSEGALGQQKERIAQLTLQSRTLKELTERMERDILAAKKAAEEAKKAEEAQKAATRERFAAAALADPARLAPKSPFHQMRGLLPRPVSGALMRSFDEDDGLGGSIKGITIATRPKVVVSSPSDGWIVFAGPFRSFGRLLIINAGGGYYLLMAGMERTSVEVGQFVLAGEPVAVMGEKISPSPVMGAIDRQEPVLYVEFRKDGTSIDPAPWWAKSQSEKVRG